MEVWLIPAYLVGPSGVQAPAVMNTCMLSATATLLRRHDDHKFTTSSVPTKLAAMPRGGGHLGVSHACVAMRQDANDRIRGTDSARLPTPQDHGRHNSPARAPHLQHVCSTQAQACALWAGGQGWEPWSLLSQHGNARKRLAMSTAGALCQREGQEEAGLSSRRQGEDGREAYSPE